MAFSARDYFRNTVALGALGVSAAAAMGQQQGDVTYTVLVNGRPEMRVLHNAGNATPASAPAYTPPPVYNPTAAQPAPISVPPGAVLKQPLSLAVGEKTVLDIPANGPRLLIPVEAVGAASGAVAQGDVSFVLCNKGEPGCYLKEASSELRNGHMVTKCGGRYWEALPGTRAGKTKIWVKDVAPQAAPQAQGLTAEEVVALILQTTYSKAEIDAKLQDLQDQINGKADQGDLDGKANKADLDNKADKIDPAAMPFKLSLLVMEHVAPKGSFGLKKESIGWWIIPIFGNSWNIIGWAGSFTGNIPLQWNDSVGHEKKRVDQIFKDMKGEYPKNEIKDRRTLFKQAMDAEQKEIRDAMKHGATPVEVAKIANDFVKLHYAPLATDKLGRAVMINLIAERMDMINDLQGGYKDDASVKTPKIFNVVPEGANGEVAANSNTKTIRRGSVFGRSRVEDLTPSADGSKVIALMRDQKGLYTRSFQSAPAMQGAAG